MRVAPSSVRYGLVVRIPGFHPGGSGSIPGIGTYQTFMMAAESRDEQQKKE